MFRHLILFLFLGVPPLGSLAAEPPKPNLILIFVDDLGYGDLACFGNPDIKTPHLDRLAAEGQRWTSFYASGSTCVVSRTGLMSGRHPNLLGGRKLVQDREALMPAMLKRAGYATAIFGKWHLAGYPDDFGTSPMHPLNCGFDEHLGTPGSNDAPGPPKQTRAAFDSATPHTWKIPLFRGSEVVQMPVDQQYLTQRYTQEAVGFIERQSEAAKEGSPFFLYLAHNMPHAPIFASPEFEGRSAGGLYGDVIEEIDWSVGQVIAAVEEADLAEDTLIVFTSDNGPWSVFGPHGGTAAPLRGEKATTWEGGLRVPGIFWWPGQIQPAEVDGLAVNLDLYATFATLTGSEPTGSVNPGYLSQDLTPALLRGEPSPRTNWLFHTSAYRSGDYKIHTTIIPPTDPIDRKRQPPEKMESPMLFNLKDDIGEQTDIAADHPEVVERLLQEMRALLE